MQNLKYLIIITVLLTAISILTSCREYNYAVITQSSFKDLAPNRELEILGTSLIGNEDLWEYTFTYTATSIGSNNIEYLSLPDPDDVIRMISSGNPKAYVTVWRKNEEKKFFMEYEYTCIIDMNSISKDELVVALSNLGITVTYTDEQGLEHTIENQFELHE